jgi:hypothetical protein
MDKRQHVVLLLQENDVEGNTPKNKQMNDLLADGYFISNSSGGNNGNGHLRFMVVLEKLPEIQLSVSAPEAIDVEALTEKVIQMIEAKAKAKKP